MEVWVLEEYYPDEGISETLGVFENLDVGLNSVNIHENIIWNENEYGTYWESNRVNDIIYHLKKFEVVLDEMPIIKD